MVDDGTYTAVLDRVEVSQDDSKLAVLLLEVDASVVNELVVERERVPEAGRQPDAVFDVCVVDGELQTIDYEPTETDERQEAAQSRFDRLSERPPDDTDDK